MNTHCNCLPRILTICWAKSTAINHNYSSLIHQAKGGYIIIELNRQCCLLKLDWNITHDIAKISYPEVEASKVILPKSKTFDSLRFNKRGYPVTIFCVHLVIDQPQTGASGGVRQGRRHQGGGIHGGAHRAEHGTISGWCSVVYIRKS
jgi:hypothetical protein